LSIYNSLPENAYCDEHNLDMLDPPLNSLRLINHILIINALWLEQERGLCSTRS